MPKRKMSWAIILWTVLFAVWIIAAIASRTSQDCRPGDDACVTASDAGTGIGVFLIIMLWFFGFIILSILWFMTRSRGRQCPRCGNDVKRGVMTCKKCGFDFSQVGNQPVSPPPSVP